MTAVIDENTALLTPEDRRAIAHFLRSLPTK
jgi:energy-coupling factor transporter ATP-binding protein EcfA2